MKAFNRNLSDMGGNLHGCGLGSSSAAAALAGLIPSHGHEIVIL